ncbi:calcium-binding protein P-like [Helicoverpa zea]|uniref:calcium-binding protein P-like n=1 Tax=Helicoverpa zea TaxID=7113 RepID=UPI001F57267C|nr:calcium-binding protein P-like [Helicoverpa zea]
MKLLLIFAAILAFSLAEEEKKKEELIDDSQAEASASIELLKEGADLKTAASTYNSYVPPSQRPPQWNAPNYVQPPQNTWLPPKEPVKPIQPVFTGVSPGVPAGVQNDYYSGHNQQWSTPVYHPPTTTTPVPVIKNEQYFGDNGYYKYEYQIADGTHVGEEGYYTDANQSDESLVKKGWYSYLGADGKTYTVTYWADKTGFHAYGDHLPTPPPVPAAIQAALDKEQADKIKPLQDSTTQAPQIFYPTQAPAYVPPQQPAYVPQQPAYVPPQQTYVPPQQTYYPPQQTYYPPQQSYYPNQQTYYPNQV